MYTIKRVIYLDLPIHELSRIFHGNNPDFTEVSFEEAVDKDCMSYQHRIIFKQKSTGKFYACTFYGDPEDRQYDTNSDFYEVEPQEKVVIVYNKKYAE